MVCPPPLWFENAIPHLGEAKTREYWPLLGEKSVKYPEWYIGF